MPTEGGRHTLATTPTSSNAPQCPGPLRQRTQWCRHRGSLRRPSHAAPAWGRLAATARPGPPSAARNGTGRGGGAIGTGRRQGSWGLAPALEEGGPGPASALTSMTWAKAEAGVSSSARSAELPPAARKSSLSYGGASGSGRPMPAGHRVGTGRGGGYIGGQPAARRGGQRAAHPRHHAGRLPGVCWAQAAAKPPRPPPHQSAGSSRAARGGRGRRTPW